MILNSIFHSLKIYFVGFNKLGRVHYNREGL